MGIEYQEVQRLWQNRLAALVGVLAVVACGATSAWWVSAMPDAEGIGPLTLAGVVVGGSAIGIGLAFHWVRLITRVGDGVLEVRLAPFRRRRFRLDEVERVETSTFRPLREYWGWGFRTSLFRGGPPSMTIAGHHAVTVTLKGGRRYVIGSLDESALNEAIESAPKIAPDEPLFESVESSGRRVTE